MGSAEPFGEDIPFESRIKCLPDEDLLEIWAESQQIETMLAENLPGAYLPAHDFEALIVGELSLRACQRHQSKRA